MAQCNALLKGTHNEALMERGRDMLLGIAFNAGGWMKRKCYVCYDGIFLLRFYLCGIHFG